MNKILSIIVLLGVALFSSAKEITSDVAPIRNGICESSINQAYTPETRVDTVEVAKDQASEEGERSLEDVQSGQDDSIEKHGFKPKTFAINLHILGPAPILGLGLEAFVTKRVALEASFGFLSLSGGIKVLITDPEKRRLNFDLGYTYGVIIPLIAVLPFHYPSIGMTYFSKKNMQVAVDVGPIIITEGDDDLGSGFYGGLTIGYRF